MAPRRWTTPEQFNFLQDNLSAYLDAQKQKTLSVFFTRLYPEWFVKFPERNEAFNPDQVLSAEDEQKLGEAVENRRTVSLRISMK